MLLLLFHPQAWVDEDAPLDPRTGVLTGDVPAPVPPVGSAAGMTASPTDRLEDTAHETLQERRPQAMDDTRPAVMDSPSEARGARTMHSR